MPCSKSISRFPTPAQNTLRLKPRRRLTLLDTGAHVRLWTLLGYAAPEENLVVGYEKRKINDTTMLVNGIE